jgi:hypothetical protein
MKKIALISSYCDTDEKVYVLIEALKKLKQLGLDTFVISPIKLPSRIVELSDFVFFTKDNPVLHWPVRGFTFWKNHYSVDGFVMMHRNVADYGWAGLYQIKKMSEIALTYDYDIFYHLIYDLEIDDYIINSINNNDINLIHPRINPHKPDEIWDATLHYMIFDREKMKKVVDAIVLKDYLSMNGVAETHAYNWSQNFDIKLSKTPVKDKIYYWENKEFFNYSKNVNYKFFIGKTDETIGQNLSPKLRIYFYDFVDQQNFKITINGKETLLTLNENKLVEFDIDSSKVDSIIITDNNQEFDYSKTFKEIERNLVYFDN